MNNLSHNYMEKNIDAIINFYQSGKLTQSQFLKKINAMSTPEQAIEKKQHKIAKTKTTKALTKAVKGFQTSKKITNDIIAQGNTIIQKLQMGYDMQHRWMHPILSGCIRIVSGGIREYPGDPPENQFFLSKMSFTGAHTDSKSV